MPFSKQLDKILRGKLWKFFGGIKTNERKSTSDCPIEELDIPSLITLPLDRHLGEGGEILVKVGERVKAGQPLTIPGGKRNVPLHASTSGEISSISMQVLPHASGFTGRCITIKPDGLDEKVPDEPMTDWETRSPHDLLERIRAFGVEGLGGAQFQTAAKIGAALEDSKGDCNIFIVNGAECEPVATCDDRLMQERSSEIAQGIEVVRRVLNPKAIIVAIENNKPNAIAAMKAAVAEDVMVREIPTLYPSGAARNLIKICTGIEIPYNTHTSECGIVVDNVETVFAIKQAVIDGIPLIKRVITVDGKTLGRTGNALVRLGTSVRFVLNAYKLNPERRQRVILGGPFMGFTLPSIDVPITKSATCVFVPSVKEIEEQQEPMNCIRCGRCARVCPSRLTPYQLYAMSRAGQHKKTKSCGMLDCTECGCCSYVCPSHIPLTGQFRKEKAILYLLDDNQRRNQLAQEHIAVRNERIAKEEEQRRKRREAALARAAKQKEADANLSDDEIAAKRAAAVAAARERAAAKRAAAAANAAATTYGSKAAESAAKSGDESASDTAAHAINPATTLAESGVGSALKISGIHAPLNMSNEQASKAVDENDNASDSSASADSSGLNITGIKSALGSTSSVDSVYGSGAHHGDKDADASDSSNDAKSASDSSDSAQAKASRMMSKSKDGMLYAAMMAQNTSMARDESGRSSTRLSDESVTMANASGSVLSKLSQNDDAAGDEAEAQAESAETVDNSVPFGLRVAAAIKHADEISHYPEPDSAEPDLSKVENPPAEGVHIPESRPRTKMYLVAPEERKQEDLKLPSALRRKDLPEPSDESDDAASDSNSSSTN